MVFALAGDSTTTTGMWTPCRRIRDRTGGTCAPAETLSTERRHGGSARGAGDEAARVALDPAGHLEVEQDRRHRGSPRTGLADQAVLGEWRGPEQGEETQGQIRIFRGRFLRFGGRDRRLRAG